MSDLRRHPPHPPTLPAWAPPSPPERAERGFRPVSAGNLLLQCSSSRTRLGGGIAVFRRRYRCHLCVKIEVHDLSQDGRGGTSRRVIRCAAAKPPALPAPSLRASISLPAKTAGPLRFLLVKLLAYGDALGDFLDAYSIFLPVLREARPSA